MANENLASRSRVSAGDAVSNSTVDALVGRVVVLDLKNTFVYVGELEAIDRDFVVLRQADAHDLRDTPTITREEYVIRCREHGVAVNRQRVLVARPEVSALCLLEEVVPN